MTCLLCNGTYPEGEILFEDGGDRPDVGPVCVHCFSRLVQVATSAKTAKRTTPAPVHRRTSGPGLVGERGSHKAPEGNTYALRHRRAQWSAWGGPDAARAQRQQDSVTFEPTCLDDPPEWWRS